MKQLPTAVLAIGVALVMASPDDAWAQLLDPRANQNNAVNAPGGLIGKTLEQQVGPGQGTELIPGSSIYLIKRDPARSVRRGRQLFQRKFSEAQGLGPRVNDGSSGDVTQARALGAGLVDSCAGCHGRPRGSAGFGGDVATRPDSRDAPHLFGLGLVEMLADEMTADLRAIRDDAVADSRRTSATVTRSLTSKGVNFGLVRARRGQVVELRNQGVDADLRVRPFFHHGGTVSMREFAIGAFNDEMGLQAFDPILCAVTDPQNPQARTSPAGFRFDPATDTFERPKACSAGADPDGDGRSNEIDAALIDHMEFYLLNYFKPGQHQVTSRAQDGLNLMRQIGCLSCHVQNLTVDRDRRVADMETAFDRNRGIFNELYASATTLFHAEDDGQPFPLILPNEEPFVVRNFFSDLKRHDLGPMFHEREYDGSLVTHFVTEPLWGVGTTAPYGHDGRSINLDQVIRRHGGEADAAKRRYVSLSADSQRRILEFLQTLVLFPPDDTASDLNPGVPGTNNPQDPSQHGSINLGELFLTDEGPE
jgi:hypothetical protein